MVAHRSWPSRGSARKGPVHSVRGAGCTRRSALRTVAAMSSPSPPPPCVALPFGITLARARVLAARDDAARAGAALVAPDLPWAGHARQTYDDAASERRSGLLRLDMLLDSCLVRLDALTTQAEADLARIEAEAAVGAS